MSKDAAKNFALKWSGRGGEESDYLFFWGDMLRDVFGVADPESFTKRQQDVFFDRATGERAKGKYDIYIPSTKVLIEQKSFGTDLDKRKLQSDGEYATPFEQAKRYAEAMPMSVRPRWIITCNFDEFRIYDLQEMDTLEFLLAPETYAPTVIKLEDFRDKFELLRFIVDPDAKISPEVKISADAAKIVRAICTAIDKKYTERDADYINALSKLCARLVFCFYADDAGLFAKTKFADYLKKFSADELQDALQKFFDALNTPEAKRDALKDFPYVNGGLFDEHLPIPPLNQAFEFAIRRAHMVNGLRLDKLGDFIKFSWREISPPIFGAMFESLFNDDTRRKAGVYYTDVKNIHKVIDPLFFDDLSHELAEIKRMHKRNRVAALKNFQDELASLNFLDPACGSGNFLTETYLSLRRLENEVLRELKSLFAEIPANPVKVTPRQFYGIEINDFAVAVAKDALWIAEIQMLRKTSWILGRELPELPLRKYISIHKANALRVDWKKIVAPENISYIIGNPPYVGYSMQTAAQKTDMRIVWADNPKSGKLDYVSAWYRKAADYIRGKTTRCAFVSTNSICQGEQCADVWQILYERLNIHIDFAHRTFKWISDSENMAHVHCVVVGFSSAPNDKPKKIFTDGKAHIVDNINAYLVDGENIFVTAYRDHIQDGVPKMYEGSKPADGGNLIIEADDLDYLLQNEPAAKKYIRPLLGAEEFIRGKKRYCLWLDGVTLNVINKMPLVAERVEACRKFRSLSKKAITRASADTPQLFQEIRQPTTNYILIPMTSSGERKYIPIDFVSSKIIATNLVHIVPNATFYHFGILTSSINMAWLKNVGSYLGTSYRYTATVVYNNFPWCEVNLSRRQTIEHTAQHILDVRKKYPDWTFAALYDESTMPDDLRDAHKLNDMAVALAYGFDKILHDEARVVAELMKLYRRLTT